MTNIEYLKSLGLKEETIDDKFLTNAIEVYHCYFGEDKVEVILSYAKQKREKK